MDTDSYRQDLYADPDPAIRIQMDWIGIQGHFAEFEPNADTDTDKGFYNKILFKKFVVKNKKNQKT